MTESPRVVSPSSRALATAGLPAVALLLAAAGATAAPADDARASGKWTVEGETVELRHARGFREPDPFGRGTNPCVLVSNQPVPDAAVPDDDDGIAALHDLMRSGELRVLQLCFDAGGTKLRNVNDAVAFHPGVAPARFAMQGYHRFAAQPAAGRIAGEITGHGDTFSGGAWSDEIELSVPMPAE